jgi:hypothetical protein
VLKTAMRCGATGWVQRERVQMRHGGRRGLAVLAAGVLLLGGGVESAWAQVGPSGQIEEFDYTLTNVSPKGFPGVLYSTGVIGTAGGSVVLQSGALREADFLTNAWTLFPTSTGTLNATLTDLRLVTGATVTGTAYVPGGASLTVTPEDTGQTIRLTNGKFSIPTGVGKLGAEPPKGGKQVVKCRGTARSCQARINLAGGARNREIVIRLTNTNLSLRSVKAPPKRKHAAYSLTHGHFARGGSQYVVILNAARSSPQGSHLILTFG